MNASVVSIVETMRTPELMSGETKRRSLLRERTLDAHGKEAVNARIFSSFAGILWPHP